jgi:hypothetical protein
MIGKLSLLIPKKYGIIAAFQQFGWNWFGLVITRLVI